MICLQQRSMILLLLLVIAHVKNVSAVSCEEIGIRSHLENTTLNVHFDSNDILKADREILCPPASDWVPVQTCLHTCHNLTHGESYEVLVKMTYSTGEVVTCGIDITIDLQPPSIIGFNVTDNLMYLTVQPPPGSFDFYTVRCPEDEPWRIFSREVETVTCHIISKLPLMNIILETIKGSLQPAVSSITQEVPLPVPFTFFTNNLLLTINVEAPPPMNIRSTYEVSLGFYADDSENTFYQRRKFSYNDPTTGNFLTYGLLPNLTHEIATTHIVESLGSVTTRRNISQIWTSPYPFMVRNLKIREEFDHVFVSWDDPHSFLEPIGFSIICNSRNSIREFIEKAVNHTCRSMRLNETESITVITEVSIPNLEYSYPNIAINSIVVNDVPDLPQLEVASAVENTITIQWDHETVSYLSLSFSYLIQCGPDRNAETVDIRSNYYQCRSLEPGKLYVIKMIVSSDDDSIQRFIGIFANTELPRSQYQNHYYVTELDGSHAVIVEWLPPSGEYDAIHVECPSVNITFEYFELRPVMFTKCSIVRGSPFTVNIWTAKSGYKWVAETVDGLFPNDLSSSASTLPPSTITSTSTSSGSTTSGSVTTATAPTSTSSGSIVGTTTTTATGSVTTTKPISPVPGTIITTGSISTDDIIESNTCTEDLKKMDKQMMKWRITAIVALIVGGFLLLAVVGLLLFSMTMCMRSK